MKHPILSRSFVTGLPGAVLSLSLLCLASPALAMDAVGLRCEYRESPAGIDVTRPRLSWALRSDDRGKRQSAYQVLVASTPEALKMDRGDLWDSGRVSSADSLHVEYDGQPLRSHGECFWKVRVWDERGKPSRWSRPASWSMGLLAPSDWKAEWIGCELPSTAANTLLPSPYFRKPFETLLPVRRAVLYATAAGLYELYLDGKRVGRDYFTPGWTQYDRRIFYQAYDVTRELARPGKHVLGAVLGDGWYGLHHRGRGHLALRAQLRLEYADGSTQLVITDGSWRTTLDGPIRSSDIYEGETYDASREMPGWNTVAFDPTSWQPARTGLSREGRAAFVDVTEKVRQAVKDDALVIAASNELFGDPAFGTVKLLRVEYEQQGKTLRKSAAEGEMLRIPAAGPLKILKAEYGADIRPPDLEKAVLSAHPGDPVRKTDEIRPVGLKEPRPGVFVFDMGQNFSGWVRLRARGKAGEKITLRFAERLNPDGTIYTANLRNAKCTDTYICRGEGTEVWEPRFTFHGFQYVELTGDRPSLDSITGVVLHTDAPLTSRFASSNPLLDRLFQNIVWGQRSNYFEVPTDCPQRDERLGWSGDAQVFIGTGAYNMEIGPFFTAWLRTYADTQPPDGAYPNVAPAGGGHSPGWSDAGVICPWTLYRIYGDTRLIHEHWDGMVRWVEFLRKNSSGLVRPAEGFGDWLNLNDETPKEVIATAYFAYSTRRLAEMAEAIGKREAAEEYRQLFEEIRAAFNRAFVDADGRIKGDTQTAYLLALGFDLLPAERRGPAAERLVKLIRLRRNHLSVGFLGVNLILPVLTEVGRPDLAWTLLTNTDYPSWLYPVTQGATTVWERWDGWTHDRGFQTPAMNSFNHYAYGACGEWMFARAAGIDTDGPGFQRIRIRPEPGGGLTQLRAHYDSIRGRIATEWRIQPDGLHLDVTIPANTTATLFLPAADAESILESGKPAARAQGVRFRRMDGDRAVFEIESGSYRFQSKLPAGIGGSPVPPPAPIQPGARE